MAAGDPPLGINCAPIPVLPVPIDTQLGEGNVAAACRTNPDGATPVAEAECRVLWRPA